MRLHLVQLAGGKGLRVGGDVPKQFRETGQGYLFAVSLQEFLRLPSDVGEVVSITVTAAEEWSEIVVEAMSAHGAGIKLAQPGSTRTASTWNALQAVARQDSPQPDDLVAVHDAARPFASAELLAGLMRAAQQTGAAVPGVPVADTILETKGENSPAQYLQRESLVAVQTPQVFRWELLHSAHQWAAENGKTFTDDGSLVAAFGTNPMVVPGEEGNWKVTTDGDWKRALNLLG